MLKLILGHGAIAGAIVAAAMFGSVFVFDGMQHGWIGMAIGYTSMLVALSMIFIAIKQYRDRDLGGVIAFWPALALGLGITLVAGLFYVVAWEVVLAVTGMDFGRQYGDAIIAGERAKGLSGPALAKLTADMHAFAASYADPLYRMPMTFTEIAPGGVLVSLVSAALLRNSRFLPARRG